MKLLQFSRDSWHYKLVAATGYRVWEHEEVDLCSYTWRVIGSILLILFLFSLGLAVSYIVIQVVLGIAFSLWYSAFLFTEFGVAGLIAIFASLMFWVGTALIQWNRNRTRKQKPDSFVSHAYRAAKEKYCARVKFD
jgi:hypothetical protein